MFEEKVIKVPTFQKKTLFTHKIYIFETIDKVEQILISLTLILYIHKNANKSSIYNMVRQNAFFSDMNSFLSKVCYRAFSKIVEINFWVKCQN